MPASVAVAARFPGSEGVGGGEVVGVEAQEGLGELFLRWGEILYATLHRHYAYINSSSNSRA